MIHKSLGCKLQMEYRVCHRPGSVVPSFTIHEVYFDEDDHPLLYSDRPICPFGDIPEELHSDLCKMLKALEKEPLNLNILDRRIELRRQLRNK